MITAYGARTLFSARASNLAKAILEWPANPTPYNPLKTADDRGELLVGHLRFRLLGKSKGTRSQELRARKEKKKKTVGNIGKIATTKAALKNSDFSLLFVYNLRNYSPLETPTFSSHKIHCATK